MAAMVRPATAADLEPVLDLLRAAALPPDGAADHFPDGFVVAGDGDGGLVGAAGLEAYGAVGLLRSVVVRPDQRGTGLGQRLSAAVVEMAQRRGLTDLYLLTTSADAFFPKLGFARVERASLPAELGASTQLQGVCCASAVAMRLPLD